jgi:tRNA-splicing ligase RtcB
MAAAANFAWANRHAIADSVRSAISEVLGSDVADRTRLVYDVAHNVAKLEPYHGRELCVHRKGATRAFPPGHPEIPAGYHGAGRRMSRTRARKQVGGGELRRELEADGITVRCPSNRGLSEEAPFAYKDVEVVVDVVERAGLAAKVAQLRPIGVVKG